MLDFINKIFKKNEPEDLKLFNDLKKQTHQETKVLNEYFDHYNYKKQLLSDFQKFWDVGKLNKLKRNITKIINFMGEVPVEHCGLSF